MQYSSEAMSRETETEIQTDSFSELSYAQLKIKGLQTDSLSLLTQRDTLYPCVGAICVTAEARSDELHDEMAEHDGERELKSLQDENDDRPFDDIATVWTYLKQPALVKRQSDGGEVVECYQGQSTNCLSPETRRLHLFRQVFFCFLPLALHLLHQLLLCLPHDDNSYSAATSINSSVNV